MECENVLYCYEDNAIHRVYDDLIYFGSQYYNLHQSRQNAFLSFEGARKWRQKSGSKIMCKCEVLRVCDYPFSHSSYKTKFAERERYAEFVSEMAETPQNQRILRFPIGENGQACLASTTQ